MTRPLTRRSFLRMTGALGGSTAMYRAAAALGLMTGTAHASRPDIAKVSGKAPTVLVLGAGIAGLTAAYELHRKGYRVQVLEASHRAGGRNLTLRAGDVVDEAGYQQVCRFDPHPDLYFNAGAARIPGHHSALLDYCRELGVELAPFINDNRNAWIQDDAMLGGRRIRAREYFSDTRGFLAEIVAKSMKPENIHAPMTAGDWEQVREYVRQLGDLDLEYRYRGSIRAGLAQHDYLNPDQLKAPLDPAELMKSRFMFLMSFAETDDQSAMMMEPVGGMDRIVSAFMQRIGQLVQLQSQVQSIQVRERGVEVVYRRDGKFVTTQADYCLNCIPMHLLAGVEHNFPAAYSAGFTAIPRGKLFKIGMQMKERFWEREGIYGGISWTMQDILQIWYPAHGINSRKGVVLGAYTFDPDAGERFARLPHEERMKLAIEQGEKVHPGYGGFVENGVSIAWHQMNHMLGCAPQWDAALFDRWFRTLQAPVGSHYLIGDQVSYHPGWQEGAIASAHFAIADMDRRRRESTVAAA